jgi:hypothetical protein
MPSFINSKLSNFQEARRIDYTTFWAEIAPCEHVLDIYSNESEFLDSLVNFVSIGLKQGDSVILIATEMHLQHVEHELMRMGLDLDTLAAERKYFSRDARSVLSKFMVADWPDEKKFQETILSLLNEAKHDGKKIRAFGEMVALLWAEGLSAATVRLEHLWAELCKRTEISLFCAYPMSGVTEDPTNSIQHIIDAHSRLVC